MGSLLITTSTLPVRDGDGVPRFVLDLAIALTKQFHVAVLAPHNSGAARTETLVGVPIRRFRYFWPERLQSLTAGGVVASNLTSWWGWLLVPPLLIAGTVATIRAIWRSGCIAVNAHWLVPMGLCAAIASAVTRVPLVLHIHAGDVYLLQRLPFGNLLTRLIVTRASWVFADGSHVRDALDALLGRSSHAVLRPMGVWVDRFRPANSSLNRSSNSVVFVGRLVEKKGVPYLLQAINDLTDDFPDLRLDIIGAGPLESQLKSQVHELGLRDVVFFLGPLAHEDVVSRLHWAAVACVPSIIDSNGETEGMPTVVIEAMAAGLRVVGSDVDGIPDVLRNQRNGWLATAADSDDLARKLRTALLYENGAISATAQADAEEHDWSKVADEYAAAVRGVVGG